MCEARCREQVGAGSRDLVDRSSALRHSNKMATRLAVKHLRVFCMSQAPRRGFFLVSDTHALSFVLHW